MAIISALTGRVGRRLLILLWLCQQISADINPEWCTKQCDCIPDYQSVVCSRKYLSQVPIMSNLTVNLYMDHNNIAHIEDTDFNNMNNMVLLNMQDNILVTVNAETSFCGLQNLKLLNLNHNKLTSFDIPLNISTECQLSNLKELLLSRNRLMEIPHHLAEYTPALEILNVSFNNLDTVKFDGNWSTLPQTLRVLDLRGNHIHYLSADDFLGLATIPLTSLSLSENSLIDIEPEAFTGLTELTSLSLSRNNGLSKSMLQKAFTAMGNTSHLCELDLFEMFLPNITSSFLGMFPHLTKLDLFGCMVKAVDPELFDRLPDLETLNLGDNSLTQLENLSALKKLRWLYVNHNQLASLDVSSLRNLEVIDISHNLFQELPGQWLPGQWLLPEITGPQLLNISFNQLDFVHPEALKNVGLQKLDMSRNLLTTLGGTGLASLYKLDLSYNQLCTVNLEVVGPIASSLRELDISHNNLSSFSGDFSNYKEFSSIQDLNLGYNRLGAALMEGGLAGAFQRMGHLLNLDLTGNYIRKISAGQFENLHHMTTLELSHNDITSLNDLALAEVSDVSRLALADNIIQIVDPTWLTKLDLLQEVDFSYNPFNCTPCVVLPFLKWLNTTLLTVLGQDNPNKYQCFYPFDLKGASLRSYNPVVSDNDCQQRPVYFHTQLDWFMIGIAITGAMVFVTLAIVLFFYSQMCHKIKSLHYRWQIRYREVSGVEFHSDLKA